MAQCSRCELDRPRHRAGRGLVQQRPDPQQRELQPGRGELRRRRWRPATLLDRNTANADQTDGIHVSGSGQTIRANVARDNDGWGIFAAPGNVDGGGNGASGNAEPAQCFNVSCTP